jgi:hypothetical protein
MSGQVVTNDSNKVGLAIVAKHSKMKVHKSMWDIHWKDVAEYVLPLKDNVYGGQVAGEKKHNALYDSVGVNSCELLASALHGMLTSPSSIWFSMGTGNPKIDNIRAVREWLQNTAKKLVAIMNNSNFQTEIHEVYLDLVGLGTAHLRIEEDPNDVVRYESRPIYELSVAENYVGLIDTIYYEYQMTIDQMVEAFDEESIPKFLLDKKKSDPMCKEDIIHAVEPRTKIPGNIGYGEFPISSVHVHKATGAILKVRGFEELPCVTPRWSKVSGEMFGRSPGMRALPDIKMVNSMKKSLIEAAQLIVTPPLQVPDDGVLLPIRTKPNSINYYRAGSKDRIEPLQIGGNLGIGEDLIELIHRSIEKAFFIDQLRMVENDRMTTVEVMQRRDESMRVMGPVLGRLEHEFLRPTIIRTFGIAVRAGLIDPIPEEISKSKLEIKFISQLAKVQESLEAENLLKALGLVQGVAPLKPQILDNLDEDFIAKFGFISYGAPMGALRDEAKVKKIREDAAKARQAQADMLTEQHQADVISKTAQAE